MLLRRSRRLSPSTARPATGRGGSFPTSGFEAPCRGAEGTKMEWLSTIGGATGSLALTLFAFLVVLTVVVFIHEYGHYWVGRRCGIGVTAFSIGFGRELIGWTDRNGTRWKISAIPLGGYVKFVGDLNAASVPDQDAARQMSPEQRAISFPHQN